MAREGRFGRLPRAAPDLSSLIVQMVREINAQEDSNYINAWENGGEVDGKKVTDQMLLKHFKKRRDDISKTDPEWQAWDQQIDDYTFSIEESKMTLKYAQHKVGEGQMAAFYTKWAKKLPQNGEAYRELMRSAAQFADAAQNRSTASSGAARQAAYDSAVNNSIQRYEADYQTADGWLMVAAERAGIIQTVSEGQDWLDLVSGEENDQSRVMDLFHQIQNDPRYGDIRAELDKAGLEDLSYGQFIQLADSKMHGIENRISIARQYDDAAGAKAAGAEAVEFNGIMGKQGGWDEYTVYQNARRNLNVQLDGDLDPFEIDALMADYHATLTGLYRKTSSNEDKGFFNNEIEGLEGRGTVGPTALEGVEGGPRTLSTADSLTMGEAWATAAQAVELLNTGDYIMSVETYVADDDPTQRLRQNYGAIRRDDPRLLNPNAGVLTALTTGKGKNARMTPVYAVYHPIMVQIDDTQNPDAAEIEGSNVIGYTYRVNGRDFWAINVGGTAGQPNYLHFSENPLKGTNVQTLTADGLIVSSAAVDDAALGWTPTGTRSFDPLSVVRANAIKISNPDDISEGFTFRYDNAWEGIFDRDANARQTLMQMTPEQVWAFAQATGDPTAVVTIRDLHDSIAERHNARLLSVHSSLGGVQARQDELDAPLVELMGETPQEHAKAVRTARRSNAGRYTPEVQALQQQINATPGGVPGALTTEQWESRVRAHAVPGSPYYQSGLLRGVGESQPYKYGAAGPLGAPPESAIPPVIRTPAVPGQFVAGPQAGGYHQIAGISVGGRPATEQFRPGWEGVRPQVATPLGQFNTRNMGGTPTGVPRPRATIDPSIFDMQHQIRTPTMPKFNLGSFAGSIRVAKGGLYTTGGALERWGGG